MPSGEWSDIEVGDRVEIVFDGCDFFGRCGTLVQAGISGGARVRIDDSGEERGFSYRSSLKKLSGRLPSPPKRPISPVFYSLKEAN